MRSGGTEGLSWLQNQTIELSKFTEPLVEGDEGNVGRDGESGKIRVLPEYSENTEIPSWLGEVPPPKLAALVAFRSDRWRRFGRSASTPEWWRKHRIPRLWIAL